MKIKSLILFTSELKKQQEFFGKVMGFELIDESDDAFGMEIGESKLIFQKERASTEAENKSESNQFRYHYCFLIPGNKLSEAIGWMQQRMNLVKDDNGAIIQHFENWNAHSIYFYDGAGNLAEFIVRHDLTNDSALPFDSTQIISVNEIGVAIDNIDLVDQQLKNNLGTDFWKGNLDRFGTHGDLDGLFLLVNPALKKTWFPTTMPVERSPFKAEVEVANKTFFVEYDGYEIQTSEVVSS